MPVSAKKTVITSFITDLIDIFLNMTVAIITGSVVMLGETIQGVSDLATDILLIIGLKRSERPADKLKPFGYGKEAYFWTLLAAIVMFVVTAGLTTYFGYRRFVNPEPASHLGLAYLALSLSIIANTYSVSVSAKRILGKKRTSTFIDTFFKSPLAISKTTFSLDFIGVIAALIGLISLVLYGLTGDARFDGLGAMVIGLTLAFLSIILIFGLRDLIVGSSAPAYVIKKIRHTVNQTGEVKSILDLKTMHLGTEKILVNLELHFADNLTTDQIETLIDQIKDDLTNQIPLIAHVQIELETPEKN